MSPPGLSSAEDRIKLFSQGRELLCDPVKHQLNRQTQSIFMRLTVFMEEQLLGLPS